MCEYICVCVCGCEWGCPVQLLSDPSFLPALFKPKLHGAAYGKGIYLSPISSISFGYSGRNGYLATQLPPAPPSPFLHHHVDWVRSVFVTWPYYHPGTLHFHVWELSMLSCCAALCCVSIFGWWALGLLLWACVPPIIPYIMLWLCKVELSVDLCVLLCTLLAFNIIFVLWGVCEETFKLNLKSLP